MYISASNINDAFLDYYICDYVQDIFVILFGLNYKYKHLNIRMYLHKYLHKYKLGRIMEYRQLMI